MYSFPALAQKKSQDVYIDKSGVMRWGTNKEEVRGFGINYTAMFAHAYRTAKRLNIPLEKAIDDDVYHFARLGFDFFRVHVWDTEISDSAGTLLRNDHLRLFDYALSKMAARGMKFVITPIAYWGNGWPEPDEKTPGFSKKYGKDACLTNPDAIKAQERYLFQFLNHENQYTGIAYKFDPAIIGFEVSNEPHHREEPAKVTSFINRMVKSMRNTGCKKPIFYNISHSIHLAGAYFDSNMQGGTFQWYPTGLGAGHELRGNFLPNVDRYAIPFASDPRFKKMAKLVYEFDAADIGRSYIYPAMARSFREAGMQIAAHFAYDPTFMADVNTEYGTHYMNLAYAPQKALSLMIASEVFHEIPMYKNYGQYPDNTSFGNFTVNYEKDLAEMMSDTKFLYTNHTSSVPRQPNKLQKIAGFGKSSLINYEGKGAYFLDRIEEGVWRLEVMPDAIWIKDPFERTSPKKKVAVIKWRSWPMSIQLADLGDSFDIRGINDGNTISAKATNASFAVSPGAYILIKDGKQVKINPDDSRNNITHKEFVAPRPSLHTTFVSHHPGTGSAGKPYKIDALIASEDSVQSVQLFAWLQGFRPEAYNMKKSGGYNYEIEIPGDKIKAGFIRYHIVVKEKNLSHTYPSGLQTHPQDWDFFDSKPYEAPVVSGSGPVMLFNAATDASGLSRQWIRTSSLIPSSVPGNSELLVNVEKLAITDPENPKGPKIHDYSMRFFVGDKLSGQTVSNEAHREKIILHARSLNGKPCKIQIALVSKTGVAFGSTLTVLEEKKDYEINTSDLKEVKLVTLPRPYPTFLPYYFEGSDKEPIAGKFEVIQLSIGPGIPEAETDQQHGIAMESIRME
ncbi:MAG: membrane or secreted protein [Cyclobacteriaceae bacterium]